MPHLYYWSDWWSVLLISYCTLLARHNTWMGRTPFSLMNACTKLHIYTWWSPTAPHVKSIIFLLNFNITSHGIILIEMLPSYWGGNETYAVKPDKRPPIRDWPVMADRLLKAVVLFDIATNTSDVRPPCWKDNFSVVIRVVSCHRFYCNCWIWWVYLGYGLTDWLTESMSDWLIDWLGWDMTWGKELQLRSNLSLEQTDRWSL